MNTMQPTSLAADKASKPHRRTNCQIILNVMGRLKNNEGVADTIAIYCPFDKTEVSRRMANLFAAGKIIDTGRKGITAKGCKAIIWRIAPDESSKPQIELF